MLEVRLVSAPWGGLGGRTHYLVTRLGSGCRGLVRPGRETWGVGLCNSSVVLRCF